MPAKATVLARKRVIKPKVDSAETKDFKLAPIADERVLKNEKKKISDPAAILDSVLSKSSSALDVAQEKSFEIPKQLPTVDFTDEPKKGNKNKKFEKRNLIDYANEPVQRKDVVKQKKPKNKFSKLTNPFPNEPSKNPVLKTEGKVLEEKSASEKPVEKMKKQPPKTPSLDSSNSGSSNTNVFTTDSVDSLKIHPFSIKNMKDVLNFSKLTHVQQKSIPSALEGKDLLIRSPTGEFPPNTRYSSR